MILGRGRELVSLAALLTRPRDRTARVRRGVVPGSGRRRRGRDTEQGNAAGAPMTIPQPRHDRPRGRGQPGYLAGAVV